MGRAPFEVRGPLPIGRARPYQTPPGGLPRRGAHRGLLRRFLVNPEPGPARPGPAPAPPPSPKRLHLHQKRRGGPRSREQEGDEVGVEGWAPELAPARSPPLGCRAAREAPRLPCAGLSSLSKRPWHPCGCQPGVARRLSPAPSQCSSLACDHRAQPSLRASALCLARVGLVSTPPKVQPTRRAGFCPDTSLGPRRFG